MDDSRIQKLQRQLKHPCLIEQPSDLFYLTGLSVSKGRLLASPSGSILYVDGRYYEKAKREAPCPTMLWEEQKKISVPEIGFDSSAVSYDEYLALQKALPHVRWIPVPQPLKEIRSIKEKREIEALKKATALTWRGYQAIGAALKEGVSEEELALEFEFFCRRSGASGLSFDPIIAFGPNSAYPHHRAGKSRLQQGQVVLIDIGAVVDSYHADMTRILYFGKPDPQIVRLETLVKQAQEKALQHIKPGVKVKELDALVRAVFEQAGVKELYTHSLGHGIGLQTHEFPRILIDGKDKDAVLKPGMVFTIEPGLYQPGVGGVRLEDMVLVTETGHENFYV